MWQAWTEGMCCRCVANQGIQRGFTRETNCSSCLLLCPDPSETLYLLRAPCARLCTDPNIWHLLLSSDSYLWAARGSSPRCQKAWVFTSPSLSHWLGQESATFLEMETTQTCIIHAVLPLSSGWSPPLLGSILFSYSIHLLVSPRTTSLVNHWHVNRPGSASGESGLRHIPF